MYELLTFLAGKAGTYIVGAALVVGAFVATYVRGRLSGASLERAKQDQARLDAAEEQLEMHREATEAERKAAGMTDDEARAEAAKWAKP